MGYQFQPQSRQGGAYATAMPTQSLLGQVLGITALGLCVTALAIYLFKASLGFGISLAAMIGGFILLFAINATRGNPALSLMLFYAFAFLEGIGLCPVIHQYLTFIGPDVVYNAAITTGLGMAAMAAIVYGTGLDLRRFQGIFTAALLGLVLIGIASIFFHFISPTVYSWLTLAIFTGYVLIDFARIRAGGDGLTPVQMAVQIYLDAINIFLALLRIFASRRED